MMAIPSIISFLVANGDYKIVEFDILDPNILRFNNESFARDHNTFVRVSVNREESTRFSTLSGIPDVARLVGSPSQDNRVSRQTLPQRMPQIIERIVDGSAPVRAAPARST